MQNPFPLIHLSSLEFDFTSIEDLPSSSLFLAQFSQNYKPAFYRPIIRELRKRREAGRATIGNQAEMGINGTRESRQKDYFPRMEFMAWDFDISAGVSSLTSAQLLVVLWKLHAKSTDILSEQAEDAFASRREKDLGEGLSLELIDGSIQEDIKPTSSKLLSILPTPPPMALDYSHSGNKNLVQENFEISSPENRGRATDPRRNVRNSSITQNFDNRGKVKRDRDIERSRSASPKSRSPRRRSLSPIRRLEESLPIECDLNASLSISENNHTNTIFIGGLPKEIDISDLENLLNELKMEPVAFRTINVVGRNNTRGGYAAFATQEESIIAFKRLNNFIYRGQLLTSFVAGEARIGQTWIWGAFNTDYAIFLWNRAKEVEREDRAWNVGGLEGGSISRELIKTKNNGPRWAPVAKNQYMNSEEPAVPHYYRMVDAPLHRQLSPIILESLSQLFISNVKGELSDSEILQYFSRAENVCGITFGSVKPQFKSRALWILFKNYESRDRVLSRWEGTTEISASGAGLYMEKAEVSPRKSLRPKARKTWDSLNLFPGVLEELKNGGSF